MDKNIVNYKLYLISKKLSDNTISSYIYDVNSFKEYLYNNYELGLVKTKKAHILTYLVNLQKQGKSSSTISRTISALKNFFEFLKKDKLVDNNPAISIHSPKQIKKSPAVLSENEVTLLMKQPDTDTFKGSRDSAILELLYSSGIKVTELINIKKSDINLNTGIINISGQKERIVPLSKHANNSIYNYMNNFRDKKCKEDNEFLFINITGESISRQGIWKILKFYEKKMKLGKELSPQILRNSFAVHLLSNGADLGTVQELMGLSSLAAAQNYLCSVEFKSLEVFKKTFPRV
ncbi:MULTISPECIES: tyrosine-type recombinase/integrase [unclassified Sedimentibacter]|uniref:tyrosine-type recombinase/integrase n=1 Tax=unclassified Sedimentibacter TaxID=2649220 RepID=UPI0027E05041|nr:tyrosine-type recombinase/integrase [Sedimentibacter sp. MB35-C1]WMJ76227.1 tyrosine-type recombinase/integrase [Sedimentibacter sp. MB35-C1]